VGYPRNRLRTPLALHNRFDKFAGSELFAIKNRSFFNQSPTLPIPTGKCPISGTEISGSDSGTTHSNTPTLEFACFCTIFPPNLPRFKANHPEFHRAFPGTNRRQFRFSLSNQAFTTPAPRLSRSSKNTAKIPKIAMFSCYSPLQVQQTPPSTAP
jgi:hypothetical protein